ncbi:NAD-dependent epimerase/dehydratase family protein [Ancylobacter radicis]|uniref:NAD-dependent epimerase/dehydratase family protein n=1 Tax=Ancylobacter radicis TaxID=2836179 RepID=A0ABS5R416_9HYPH|nr:NAD-dependent epimerase/dehydratase family protein [Ancylobacter radicis]MBS9475955.1 NAD-dependent epimerase/dehydratase family protein [Ancylobacter radicis]
MTTKTVLVLGATGGIGGAMAHTLLARGWQVRALTRSGTPGLRDGILWQRGDALAAADVARAAEGASLIVHAVNPPGYRDWDRLVLPMLANTLAAARAGGARLLLPGTVYNYGPDVFAPGAPLITEDAPQAPLTRKGAIRVAMERELEAAAARGDSPVLIVRAGDYFGPQAANNWFGQVLVKAGTAPRSIQYPGRAGVGHQWAYLPDVAETMARLVERDDLPAFARFHMDGHWDDDGTRMIGAIRRVLGAPDLPVKAFPWTLARLASPVVPLFRELMEMRYLWQEPVRLDNGRLRATLGAEPHTPLDEAVRASLIGLGCLRAAPQTSGGPDLRQEFGAAP